VDVAELGIGSRDPGGELVHVGLAEHHRAGVLQLLDGGRIQFGLAIAERLRSYGRNGADHIVNVLHHHRDAMQRTSVSAAREFLIALLRALKRLVFQQGDEGVELRLETLDAAQVGLRQSERAQRAVAKLASGVGDRFRQFRARHRCGRRRRCPTVCDLHQVRQAGCRSTDENLASIWVSRAIVLSPYLAMVLRHEFLPATFSFRRLRGSRKRGWQFVAPRPTVSARCVSLR
jgi:hypothetical protein